MGSEEDIFNRKSQGQRGLPIVKQGEIRMQIVFYAEESSRTLTGKSLKNVMILKLTSIFKGDFYTLQHM